MFSRFLIIGSISLGLFSSGVAKAVDKADVEEARLQVALAQVGCQMAIVKVKQIQLKVEALEQAASKGQATKFDLEMTKLDMEAAGLNVKAAEINVARATNVLERTERALKGWGGKASSPQAEGEKAKKTFPKDVKQGTDEPKKARKDVKQDTEEPKKGRKGVKQDTEAPKKAGQDKGPKEPSRP